jgi:hypothetical protein
MAKQKTTLWVLAVGSIVAMIVVQLISSFGKPSAGAGPQPTSTGGGTGN